MQAIKQYISYKMQDKGIYIIETNSAPIKLIFLSDEILRVRTNFKNNWDESSYILVKTAWADNCDDYLKNERVRVNPIIPEIEENSEEIVFSTCALRVVIKKKKFIFEIYDKENTLLHSDLENRAFVEDHLGRVYHYSSFCEDSDKFYGFGEHGGTLEKSYQRLRLSPKDALGHNPKTGSPLYKHIPFYIKHNFNNGKSIGMFYHNTFDCSFDMGAEVSGYWKRYTYYNADGGEIDLFFIGGKDIAKVISNYTDLTGKTIMPPKYALGYLGSSMYYAELPQDCDKEIVNFIDKNHKEEIPIDGFQLSSGYTTGADGKRYFFTWNKTRFPNPKDFFSKMNERGVMCSPNIKPGILLTHPLYDTWKTVQGFILDSQKKAPYIDAWWGGDGSFVDFTSPQGREVWKKHLTDSLLANGVTSIWNDNCEYEINDNEAFCSFEGKGAITAQGKNIQSLIMNRVSHEAMETYCPDKRPFVVSRSGCAGLQRYASTWAGDNATSWDTLKYDVATVLNMSLSGVANNGCDVSGFYGPHPEEELFVRWVQCGIFFPRFSIHSCNTDNTVTEPWMYKKSTPLIRAAIKLRYSLLPYLYTLMKQASENGSPILRPLFYEFPLDENAAKDWGQFMLGSFLLAAPVLDKGAKEKTIYLPKGSRWYDYYTRKSYEGGQFITIPVNMESIPLFIRENALIARNFDIFTIAKDRENYFDIIVSAGTNFDYMIYEDDGNTNNYKKGDYLKTHISVTAGSKVILKVSYEGTYKSAVKNIILDVINTQKAPFKVFLDKQEIPPYLDEDVWKEKEFGWHYDRDLKSARIRYPKPQKDYSLIVSFEAFDLIGMAISEEEK
ncbi:MAG: DUF4968 domain-containing protein [Elusimicrobiota bacterium]|jgi:alpha-glucosidase|nr:DUF4968 domain-containing protein [Elusimicrobiota bacterium]